MGQPQNPQNVGQPNQNQPHPQQQNHMINQVQQQQQNVGQQMQPNQNQIVMQGGQMMPNRMQQVNQVMGKPNAQQQQGCVSSY